MAIPEYSVWTSMNSRCTNPKDKPYPRYGGRGIKVCDRWTDKENGFTNFLADMGKKPSGFSIERIDVNGDYTPENCKWIPFVEQNKNKRNTIFVDINNSRVCLKDACKLLGLPYHTVRIRVSIRKWTIEEALELVPRTT